MKVLFCSPYSDAPNVIKGGINTWGRYLIEYYSQCGKDDVDLVSVSFDRHSDVLEGQSYFRRVISGYKEYRTSVKEAVTKMDEYKPNVVHICTCAGLGLFRDLRLLFSAKKRCIKAIVHLHFGRIPELISAKNWEWCLLSIVLRLCAVPIVMNRLSEKSLFKEGYSNVVYLPNPLGMSTLSIISNQVEKYKRIPRRLVFCGHVISTKGVIELVEGCRNIPDIELRILGKYLPSIKQQMEDVARKSGNDISWMKFVGEIDQDEVIREFFQADMFVFPSYTEGFPNVILEAMACGCPIVASRVGAIPEMLDIDGDACGICIEPRNAGAVFKAVASLIDDNALKCSLAAKAKRRVSECYTIPHIWKQLVDVWKND